MTQYERAGIMSMAGGCAQIVKINKYFIKYLLSARPGAMLLEYYIVAMIISKRRLELSNLLQGLGQGENLPAIRQAALRPN